MVGKGGTFIFGGTFLMKPQDVTGGTFILGGTFQKNFCKSHLVRLLETVRLISGLIGSKVFYLQF